MNLKRKIEILGLEIPIFLIVAALIAAPASAALLNYYGTITGTTEVSQSVLVDELDINSGSMDIAYDYSGPAGKTLVDDPHHMENTADNEATVNIETACTAADSNCNGLTYKAVEYFDDAGADLDSYTPPAKVDCDVNVGSSETIEDAIVGATAGDTVCVPQKSEPYTETSVNKSIILASEGGEDAAMVGGFNIKADGVTIKGFKIGAVNEIGGGQKKAIYLSPGLSDVTIEYNEIGGSETDENERGIVTPIGEDYSNIVIENNYFLDNLATGIYTNPHSGNFDIQYNTFESGIGGAMGANVEYNVFADGTGIGTDDYHHAQGYDNRNLVIEFNNFEGTAYIHNYALGHAGDNGEAQDAPNNWWDVDGINKEENSGAVVNAGWKTKEGETTLVAGERDRFSILSEFPINTEPDTFTIETTIAPI